MGAQAPFPGGLKLLCLDDGRNPGVQRPSRALTEVFGRHGLPLSLYTDRGSHYFYTPEAGGKVDRSNLTQVGRALEHLGVEHIAAYSPQARGRSERAFHTLQDRLTKELALAGIVTIEAANGRCCMDIDPGEGAPSPSDFKKLCAGGGRRSAPLQTV
jgi:hypothetical protein